MRQFALEVAEQLHGLTQLEKLAVGVSSERSSAEGQYAQAAASDQLYAVISKQAEADSGDTKWEQMCGLTDKLAQELDKEALTNDQKAKLAAAVIVDDTITEQLKVASEAEKPKIAATRLYGREYMVELLKGILT